MSLDSEDSPRKTSSKEAIHGSCLCGGVRFTVTGRLYRAIYCHCSRCQKHSGTAASAQARVRREFFRLLAGDDLIETYRAEPGGTVRAFCRVCGSSLFGGSWPEGEEVSIRLGAFEGDPGVRPEARGFVGSRAAWEDIADDGLAHFAGRVTAERG